MLLQTKHHLKRRPLIAYLQRGKLTEQLKLKTLQKYQSVTILQFTTNYGQPYSLTKSSATSVAKKCATAVVNMRYDRYDSVYFSNLPENFNGHKRSNEIRFSIVRIVIKASQCQKSLQFYFR